MVVHTLKQYKAGLESTAMGSLLRLHSQMPLARKMGAVTIRSQQFRDRCVIRSQRTLITGFAVMISSARFCHSAQTGFMVIQTGEKHGAGRRTGWGSVEIGELNAFTSQR